MAELGEIFDSAETLKNDSAYKPLPAGEYTCQIISTGIGPNKKGTGKVISLQLLTLETTPQREFRVWINFTNTNETAENIGKAQFGYICHAFGITGRVNNTDELLNKIAKLPILVKPGQGQYSASNSVDFDVLRKRFRTGGAPAKASQSADAPKAPVANGSAAVKADEEIPF